MSKLADVIPLHTYPVWLGELIELVEYTSDREEPYKLHWGATWDEFEKCWDVFVRPFAIERDGKRVAPKNVVISIDLPFTEKLSEMSLTCAPEGFRIFAQTKEGNSFSIIADTIPAGFRMKSVKGRSR